VICLEQTLIEEPSLSNDELPTFETLMDNQLALRLCDTNGRRFYINETLKLSIVVCFNDQDWAMG